jgi:hypothetical protein
LYHLAYPYSEFSLKLLSSLLTKFLQVDRAHRSGDAYIRASVDDMQGVFADDRGTVRALAREVDENTQDGMSKHNQYPYLTSDSPSGGLEYALSSNRIVQNLDIQTYQHLVAYLELGLPVRSCFAVGPEVLVPIQVSLFGWVVISQHRYSASSRSNSSANSIIAVRDGARGYKVGELVSIFVFKLGLAARQFVRMGVVRYLTPAPNAFPEESAWSST